MGAKRKRIIEIVNNILRFQGQFQIHEIAKAAKITRQAAHRHLASMVQRGDLEREGKGRGRISTFLEEKKKNFNTS